MSIRSFVSRLDTRRIRRWRSGLRKAGLALALMALPGTEATADVEPARPLAAAGSATVVAKVRSLRNDNGKVVAFIFSSSEGFPAKRELAVSIQRTKIANGVAELRFSGLAPGEYAISTFHDEDLDDRLGLNWLGLPKEGVAISNGERFGIAYPRYKNARFTIPAGTTRMPIKMRYWIK